VFGIVSVLLWADTIPIEFLSLKMLCILTILVRDFGITILRRRFPMRAKKVPSLGTAKAKTVFFMLALGCIMVGDSQEVYRVWIDQTGMMLLQVATVFAVISGSQYVWRFVTVRV
jgi:phosphatidylglycerophosphate synthase